MNTKKIFDEIDKAIEECKSKSPILWDNSKFKKLYEEIKIRFLLDKEGGF